MKRFVLCTALVGLIAVSFGSAQAANTLSVGTEGDAPPFSMADANGHVTGYDADVANALCDKLKLQCKFIVQSFNTLIPSLAAGQFDVVISGLGITDARRKQIDYSNAYASGPLYFIARKGSPALSANSLNDVFAAFSGKPLGVVNGTTYAKYVEKHVSNADIKTYDSVNELLSDLKSKRLAGAFGDAPTWADFLKTDGGDAFQRVESPVRQSTDPTVLGYGMGVGIKKGNVELKRQIDTALCTLSKDGTLTRLSEKWFHEDNAIPCKS